MSIVEMSKLKLIGISYEKEKILNVLHRTGTVELKTAEELKDTEIIFDTESINEATNKLEKLNAAIASITSHLNANKKNNRYPTDTLGIKDYFDCGYDEFMIAAGNEFDVFYIVDKIQDYNNRIAANATLRSKTENLIKQVSEYTGINEKFSAFKDTVGTYVLLGKMGSSAAAAFKEFVDLQPLSDFKVLKDDGTKCIVSLICFKESSTEILAELNTKGFEKCPFDFDVTAEEKIEELKKDLSKCIETEDVLDEKICRRAANLRNMKIYADYLNFQIAKLKAAEELRNTQNTFVLEAFVPTEQASEVKNQLVSTFDAILVETEVVPRDEFAPTLTKNNKVFKSAEFVTNMYAPPSYGEIDPNPSVFIFFTLFLGYIMADMGYGLLLVLAGFIGTRLIKRETGMKKILRIIAWSGVATILWGALFASLFGATLYTPILPSPYSQDNKDYTMLTLLFSLGMGIIHIAVGYIMKGLNLLKKRRIVDAIFDAFVWIPFFIGMLMFGAPFLFDFFMQNWRAPEIIYSLKTPGLYLTLASFIVIALSSVKNGKGFGRVIKPFGAAYGLINLFSDILSYARLFGLLLAGVVFAQRFNMMGIGLMTNPVGYIFGPLVIILGHTFNLAMGVLGAYIHDSRLQYIEYFNKFYQGEGELFAPFASEYNYINLTK